MSQNTSELIKSESLDVAYAIFGDAWLFLKKIVFTSDAYEQWCKIRDEALDLSLKYNKSRLCSKILVVIMCEAERRSKSNTAYRIATNADLENESKIFSQVWNYYKSLVENGSPKYQYNGGSKLAKDLYEVINVTDLVQKEEVA